VEKLNKYVTKALESVFDHAIVIRTAGVTYAAGTSIQRKLGIEDSPDRMYKLFTACVPNANEKERERLRNICDGSADVIEWLLSLGVRIPAVMGTPGLTYNGMETVAEYAAIIPPVPGAHICEGEGKGLQAALMSALTWLRCFEIGMTTVNCLSTNVGEALSSKKVVSARTHQMASRKAIGHKAVRTYYINMVRLLPCHSFPFIA
jgi:hypothetical protein